MTKEIYISSTPHETRLAVVEDDQLAEIYYERENEYTLAGSIYKGKVTRVLPGMQSAFVDIGLERDAFLYVTDFAEEQEDGEEYVPLPQGQSQGNGHKASGHSAPSTPRNAEVEQQANTANQPRRETSSNDTEAGGDAGGRRWRGRRGRRRGRGSSAPSTQSSATTVEHGSEQDHAPNATEEQPISFELIPEQPEHTAETPAHGAPKDLPSLMMLPGESLSKYRRDEPGSSSAARTSSAAPHTPMEAATPAAASHAPSFQPSTMVVAPLAWDGSGLLPGESLSRYKNRPAPSLSSPSHPSSSPAAEVGEVTDAQKLAHTETIYAEPQHDDQAIAHTAIPEQAASSATPSAPLEGPEFKPTEASASYRFDPSTPSAYRQSSVAEPASEETPSASASQEEHYPVTATPPVEQAQHPDAHHLTAHSEIAPSQPVPTPEPFTPELFFDAAISIAPPAHVEPRPHENVDSQEDLLDENEVSENGQSQHAFDPGHGDLEEEMIDEEESEGYAAHALLDDAEFDDLVEETLDMQMDSGLLSELVRDQHIDQRTRFVEEPGTEDEEFDEQDTGIEGELGEIELGEVDDSDETDESATENADANAASAPARSPRHDRDRRGGRGGRQRSGQGQGRDRSGRMRRSTAQTSNLPAITELLKPNQEILVQIAKEPIARKGARITSHIALPGRFLVFMPTVNHVGVSRKISSDEERQRLKHILLSEKGAAAGGFIVRTAAADASEEDLRADIRFLLTLWAEIKQRADSSNPPALIYHDLSLVERVLRDQVTDNFSAIWVDSESDYERVLRFLNRFEPALVRRVKLYTKETPLFEQFGIQEEINKALRSKVWLKSGGSIVINQTEALVAIDINTGKYVGKTARLEDTILKTNLDAIPEIVRQIRLRDLGGIIVIDFIDMDERKNRNKVMQALEEELKSDRAPSKVLQFNDFGLVAITRKRVKQSLERTLSVPCSICTGTGMVKGPLTVCNEIYIELRKMHRHLDRGDVLLRVHPEVVKQLKVNNGRWLSEMEEMSGKTVIVKSDPSLHPEQFDIH